MSPPVPVVYQTVVQMLSAAARDARGEEALVLDGVRVTYGEYVGHVAALAAELREEGASGERVATVLPNGFDTCIASFAAWAAGAQLVPLNPLYTQRELREILADSQPRVLICSTSHHALCAPLAEEFGIYRLIVVGPGERSFLDQSDAAGLGAPDPASLALLQYTGGTTGRAKGVNLTHAAMSMNVSQREAALPTGRGERLLCAMPLFHAYGFAMGLLLAPFCRGTLVIRERYHPKDLLAHFALERISIFPGAPTIYNGLVAHEDFRTTDFSTLHTCYSGSAPLAVDVMSTWEDVTGAPIYEGYGQTEAGPVLAYNQIGQPMKPGTVGTPLVDTHLRLFDTETGEYFTDSGRVGEICARGPQLMVGYRGLKDETDAALRDGWLHTGDLGEFDADGYLVIRDRLKDMVIVGGYNVYPREVDEILFSHPDVVDAAAVGAPDSYRGEVIRAWVVLREGVETHAAIESIRGLCERDLARYKQPVSIDVIEGLPKTTVNKTDKTTLRDLTREKYPAEATTCATRLLPE